jgi:Fe-S-cluster containining protein
VKQKDPARMALNGVSVQTIELDQEGNLTVSFDLPVKQTTTHYETSLTGSRTFDVYECPELHALVKKLFAALRARILAEPDADMAAADCDRCRESSCCREYNVLVSEADIDRLRGTMSRAAFTAKYTTKAVDWSGDFARQLACDRDAVGEKCVFLQRDRRGRMRCSVYARRPWICRNFDMATCTDFTPLDGGPPKDGGAG